jgi:hypothetical protein
MGSKTVRFDDLLGTESPEVTQHKFTVDGVEVEPLDLLPSSFEALEALLVKRDPDLLRAVFAPATVARRSHEEIEHIRTVANEAKNPDGSKMFEVKGTGRLPRTVITWFETEYEPAQANAEANAEGNAEGEAASGKGRARR